MNKGKEKEKKIIQDQKETGPGGKKPGNYQLVFFIVCIKKMND